MSDAYESSVFKFAEMAIRAGLLINGGACLALLSFSASDHPGATRVMDCMIYFVLGVVASSLAPGAAYFAQLYYVTSMQVGCPKSERIADRWKVAAAIFIIASVVLFLTGALNAGQTIRTSAPAEVSPSMDS